MSGVRVFSQAGFEALAAYDPLAGEPPAFYERDDDDEQPDEWFEAVMADGPADDDQTGEPA